MVDQQGDNSLGDLQSPLSSTLYQSEVSNTSSGDGKEHDSGGESEDERDGEGVQPTGAIWSVEDRSRRYLGWLVFSVVLQKGKRISFVYGESGYVPAILFVLNASFIKQHRLEHLVP
jgi:hypothetical protein